MDFIGRLGDSEADLKRVVDSVGIPLIQEKRSRVRVEPEAIVGGTIIGMVLRRSAWSKSFLPTNQSDLRTSFRGGKRVHSQMPHDA